MADHNNISLMNEDILLSKAGMTRTDYYEQMKTGVMFKGNEIKFCEWVAENHYHLFNIENSIYIWQNENGTKTTAELFEIWQHRQ